MHRPANSSVITPRKTHSAVVARAAENSAGSVSTGKSRNFRKRMRRRDACHVTDPKKKRAAIVKRRLFGAAWMDKWSRLARKNVAHEEVTPTVPSKKHARIAKGRPAGCALTARSSRYPKLKPRPEAC